MAAATFQEPYMLAHRQGNIEEDRRLDAQHEMIKFGIQDGQLIHSAIPLEEIKGAVADVGCGTGVWLNDIARSYFASRLEKDPPLLVGWDVDSSRFTKNPEPGVQLHQHDCVKPFPDHFHSKFDLVSIRLLAYAVPEEGFNRVIENAVQLLRPGGYLLWFDSEMSNFRATKPCPEVDRSVRIIADERRARELVPYLPPFMLNSLLRLQNLSFDSSSSDAPPTKDLVTITHFQYYTVGPIPENESKSPEMKDRVNTMGLEAMKLLLMAGIARKKKLIESPADAGQKESLEKEVEESQKLESFLSEALTNKTITLFGQLPFVVARKW